MIMFQSYWGWVYFVLKQGCGTAAFIFLKKQTDMVKNHIQSGTFLSD